jgi:hypothetical protein
MKSFKEFLNESDNLNEDKNIEDLKSQVRKQLEKLCKNQDSLKFF